MVEKQDDLPKDVRKELKKVQIVEVPYKLMKKYLEERKNG
jgi:hypothetical protein